MNIDEIIRNEFSKCLDKDEMLISYVWGCEYLSFWGKLWRDFLYPPYYMKSLCIGLTNQRLLIIEISPSFSFERLTSLPFTKIEKIETKDLIISKIFYIRLKDSSEEYRIKIPKIGFGIPRLQKENFKNICRFLKKLYKHDPFSL